MGKILPNSDPPPGPNGCGSAGAFNGRAWLSPRSETTHAALDMQGSLFHPTISRMGNTQPTASSPLASPSRPSPVDLQAHLYASLLEGHTADVTLRIRGAWEAIYKLHRVVLIQAVSCSQTHRSKGTRQADTGL